ncbi:DinB family protein [Algoriphagus aestuariicola]|uniref:DinB family protein n=1 Tax=Algoriphagus aestuariicola TaxID=1852016 RepID=A0ABS3BLP4_9BACT|nr:DinB family protein [Algoriphagus aestuariicola]MBN7800208.1 DinB family protein [Algoriphagus aestuariicola]
MTKQPEVWLRGPIAGLSPLLQPVVHSIRQAQEEIHELMKDFPSEMLWEKPAGVACPAFHLQHIAGVMDRMASYAQSQILSEKQFDALKREGLRQEHLTTSILLENLDGQIEHFVRIVTQIDPSTLADFRPVGRAKLPSTVGGLLFHAAEHAQRHLGQLLVTVKMIGANKRP